MHYSFMLTELINKNYRNELIEKNPSKQIKHMSRTVKGLLIYPTCN